MNKKFNVAVLGATGAVGEIVLELLSQRKFPYQNVYPLASEKSANDIVILANKRLSVIDVAEFDWSLAHVAIFTAGSQVSQKYIQAATKAGCVVIDNTSAFRQMPEVPLVIPEINAADIANYKNLNLIANPNCVVIQALMAIQPIHHLVGIKRLDIASYQSVSGTGRKAISELVQQSTNLLTGQPIECEVYPWQIAFNCLAQIGECELDGFCDEEQKIIMETHKILKDPNIVVNPSTVRVPTLYGHGAAIHIETYEPLGSDEARKLLSGKPGICIMDDPKNNISPSVFVNAVNNDDVYIGRIRNNPMSSYILNMWVVSDNIRKGAALNSIQIAEILVDRYI